MACCDGFEGAQKIVVKCDFMLKVYEISGNKNDLQCKEVEWCGALNSTIAQLAGLQIIKQSHNPNFDIYFLRRRSYNTK